MVLQSEGPKRAHRGVIIIIIIITNEKSKVMLSRKRCRDTLRDYNKGEISKCQSKLWTNRNVLNEQNVYRLYIYTARRRILNAQEV